MILLHGLERTNSSMRTLERTLEDANYTVVNNSYPSRKSTVEVLAETAISKARLQCDDAQPDVVTHSMGGILMRSYAQNHPDEKWGRVVMLGPPNQGSGIIDAFSDNAIFRKKVGPAGMQLRSGGLPDALPAVPFETGVIAGTQSLNPITSALVEGDDDGKVSVESTKVEGMKSHLTLPVTHTFMMDNPRVIAQVLHFLNDGSFAQDLTYGEALRRIRQSRK